MKRSKTQKKGVIDFEKKLQVMFSIVGKTSPFTFALELKGLTFDDVDNNEDLHHEVQKLADNIFKWKSTVKQPDTGPEFIKLLCNRLLNTPYNTSEAELTYATFYGTIQEFKSTIKFCNYTSLMETPRYVRQETVSGGSIINDKKHYQTSKPHDRSLVTAKDVLDSSGRIDQKYHYLSPNAEELWLEVVGTRKYKQFDECQGAIYKLCGSDVWHKFFMEGGNGVVMLGGGSAPKDMDVIRSALNLLPSEEILHYVLVDFSPFMLDASLSRIAHDLIEGEIADRVRLESLQMDFLNFEGTFHRSDKKLAWMIPGGTIGNVDEERFFESIASESLPGDMLVIGAETFEANDLSVDSKLKSKYMGPGVRKFLQTPLRAAWHELMKHAEKETHDKILTIEYLANCIIPDVVDGVTNKYSKVEGSKTMELSLLIGGRKFVPATSNRYLENNLIEFASSKGFKHMISVESPINEKYKQFVFFYDPNFN